MLTCLFVLFVCVITHNEQVVAVANDDDALESGEGSGDPGQACVFLVITFFYVNTMATLLFL